MKFLWIISPFTAAVLAVSGTAFALDYKADLSLTSIEQYNDNIFLSHTEKTHDYITEFNPSAMLSTKTETADVSLQYSPLFSYYKTHTEKNDVAQQANAQGLFKLTDRLTAGLSDVFLQTKDLLTVRSVEGVGPLVSAKDKITMNTLTGNLAYRVSEQLTLTPSVIYNTTSNSEVGFSDITTYTGAVDISYLLTGRTTLKARVEYDIYEYSIGGNVDEQKDVIGVLHKFTPTFSVDANVGIDISSTQLPPGTDEFLIGNLAVTKTFEKGSASLSYVNGIITGVQALSPLREQLLTLTYTRPVTAASIDASISAFYGIYKAIGHIVIDEKRNDMGASAKLSYKPFRWAELFVSYSYINSDDKIDHSGSYVNNVIMAGLKLSKQLIF
jgi:hypothetical protein